MHTSLLHCTCFNETTLQNYWDSQMQLKKPWEEEMRATVLVTIMHQSISPIYIYTHVYTKSINKIEGVRYPENDDAMSSYILS